ncbi:DUF1217 domain-containing protein [Epibacterium ulvae]|uniref:DUF1217 domain-containing protein n=1 Tax=Epibacterium ulvae TaxID=1156985 RepID=UPI00248FA28E|nr:DUF1217 domain-containing protein [Epibacterium ulvae]
MTFSPIITGPGIIGYRYLTETRESQQAVLAESAEVSRLTDGFVEELNSIETADQLLANRDVLTVVLGSFGLQDDIGNFGLLKRVLESDLSDSSSLANRMPDTRYLELARAFNFVGEGGPSLAVLEVSNPARDQLARFETADDLLNATSFADRNVLNDVLEQFGLEQYAANTNFLKRVLESDPDEVGSFTNRLADTGLIEFSRAFNNVEKEAERAKYDNTIYRFAELFEDEAANIKTVDDLFAKPELLDEALNLFGVSRAADRADFLRDVLDSDLDDENSFVNQQEDPRYFALASAFEFHERSEREAFIATFAEDDEDRPRPFESNLEKMVEAINDLPAPLEEPQQFLESFSVLLSAKDFFGLEFSSADNDPRFANQGELEAFQYDKIFSSDRNDPFSFVNVKSDPRFRVLAGAFNFQPPQEDTFTYPDGFAEKILENYLDEEFVISVGEVDPTQRFALAFEPGVTEIVDGASSEDSEWFSVIASNPLREVFQTIFGLPDSFGTLDVDQQVTDLKARAQSQFGVTSVSGLIDGGHIDTIRTRYLSIASITNPPSTVSSPLLSLFA